MSRRSVGRVPRRRASSWPLLRIVALGTLAALVFGVLLGQVLAWIVADSDSWWNPWSKLTSAQIYDVVRSDVASVALVGAGGAALIAYRRQRTAEDEQTLAEMADLRDRYTKAVELLGHEKAAVRLAGVYALALLADRWSLRRHVGERQVCVDVLCAYLRMTASDPEDVQEGEVRATVVDVLRRHLLDPSDNTSWCDASINLSGASLWNADFSGATFSGRHVSFDRAVFSGEYADLEGARFTSEASFVDAKFHASAAVFKGARFSGRVADFTRSSFRNGVNLNDATFEAGSIIFADAVFSAGAVRLARSTITAARLEFFDAQLNGDALDLFRAVLLDSAVLFDGASVRVQRIILDEVQFGGDACVDLSRVANLTSSVSPAALSARVKLPAAH